jgi:hypothetical protein
LQKENEHLHVQKMLAARMRVRGYYKIREGRVRKRIFEMVKAVGAASHGEGLAGRKKSIGIGLASFDRFGPIGGQWLR